MYKQEASVFDGNQSQAKLMDDAQFSVHRQYTTVIDLLRRLDNDLAKTIASWNSFESGEIQYFQSKHEVHQVRWAGYLGNIRQDVKDLRSFRPSLQHSIETFTNMRAGLISASAMVQSRIVTEQAISGRNIGRLTRVTVPEVLSSFELSNVYIQYGNDPRERLLARVYLGPSPFTRRHAGGIISAAGTF
ncbi:hypothetical protein MMC11_007185 [Xylographa trunciseda]|nr:hypothetical protein [Xylographa trunciseda]